jgi:SAM-dependent methyltransferase
MNNDRPMNYQAASDSIPENVYGSQRRVRWIGSHLRPGDRVVEFGCGTGLMVTLPLLRAGVNIVGFDTDERSLSFGRHVFAEFGATAARLLDEDPIEAGNFDVIIASELLEHLHSPELTRVLNHFLIGLRPGGRLLVTAPNGYGWFEFEQAVWTRLHVRQLLERTKVVAAFDRLRVRILGHTADDPFPNTLADEHSPHVQRFTLRSLNSLLVRAGFDVIDTTGSVLVAGPITNMLFRGFDPFLRLNGALGTRLPRIAAGYFVACRRPVAASVAKSDA